MRIAVASDGGQVAQHFGRCAEYVVYDVVDGEIGPSQTLDNPGHQPGFLPRYLAERGVNCIIAGGMGPRAQALFADQSIEAVVGAQGPVDRAVQAYLDGTLKCGPSSCSHGGEH